MKKILKTLGILSLILVWDSCSEEPQLSKSPDNLDANAKKLTKFLPPTLACSEQSESTITLQVTASSTGSPAGFSIQWMTEADYIANGNAWYLSDDPRLCKASFSGNANSSRYNLAPGATVLVTIGNLSDDPGASTSCSDFLNCGTTYVFRTFSHATSTVVKSDFSANTSCSTVACPQNCTYGLGYWKNHPEEWPVDSMTVGGVTYDSAEIMAILWSPAPGGGPNANGYVILAHQLIPAMFNVANGAILPPDVAQLIADAEALIGNTVIAPVGTAVIAPNVTSGLASQLELYNIGYSCD